MFGNTFTPPNLKYAWPEYDTTIYSPLDEDRPCFNDSLTFSGSYNWTWPQASSLTAMKYQRHGYVDKKPFLPGER